MDYLAVAVTGLLNAQQVIADTLAMLQDKPSLPSIKPQDLADAIELEANTLSEAETEALIARTDFSVVETRPLSELEALLP